MSFKVEIVVDEHNCETCGHSSAEGYRIYEDGELVSERLPVASCFSRIDYYPLNALIEIIEAFGEHVTIEYEEDDQSE